MNKPRIRVIKEYLLLILQLPIPEPKSPENNASPFAWPAGLHWKSLAVQDECVTEQRERVFILKIRASALIRAE
jgi:hypothetical protein